MQSNLNRRRLMRTFAAAATVGSMYLMPVFLLAQSTSKDVTERTWECLKGFELARNRSGNPIWLTTRDLETRILKKTALQTPGTLGKNNLHGAITLQILLEKDGTVACVRAISGNPAATSSAIAAIHDWLFEPYRRGTKTYAVLGEITIAYDFRTGGPDNSHSNLSN